MCRCSKYALEGTALNIRGSILRGWVSAGALLGGVVSVRVSPRQPQGHSTEHKRVHSKRVGFYRGSFGRVVSAGVL